MSLQVRTAASELWPSRLYHRDRAIAPVRSRWRLNMGNVDRACGWRPGIERQLQGQRNSAAAVCGTIVASAQGAGSAGIATLLIVNWNASELRSGVSFSSMLGGSWPGTADGGR